MNRAGRFQRPRHRTSDPVFSVSSGDNACGCKKGRVPSANKCAAESRRRSGSKTLKTAFNVQNESPYAESAETLLDRCPGVPAATRRFPRTRDGAHACQRTNQRASEERTLRAISRVVVQRKRDTKYRKMRKHCTKLHPLIFRAGVSRRRGHIRPSYTTCTPTQFGRCSGEMLTRSCCHCPQARVCTARDVVVVLLC